MFCCLESDVKLILEDEETLDWNHPYHDVYQLFHMNFITLRKIALFSPFNY